MKKEFIKASGKKNVEAFIVTNLKDILEMCDGAGDDFDFLGQGEAVVDVDRIKAKVKSILSIFE